MRWVGQVAHMGQKRNAYRNLVEGHEGKEPRGISRHRWEAKRRRTLEEKGGGYETHLPELSGKLLKRVAGPNGQTH
jgi:hypothetical protein